MSRYTDPFKQLNLVFNKPFMKQFEHFSSIIDSNSMRQCRSINTVLGSTGMKQFESVNTVVSSTWIKQFESINTVIGADYIKQFANLESIVNRSTGKEFRNITGLSESLIGTSKLSFLPDEFFVTLKLLRQHQELFAEFKPDVTQQDDFDQEEFSDVLSEVNEDLRQDNIPQKLVMVALKKLPSMFFILLKYFFDNVAIPLIVCIYLQPMIKNYISTSNESYRVQKSKVKKISQNIVMQTTSANRFISGSDVNLRSSASIKSKVITKLNFGQSIYILEKKRSWIKVSIPKGNGIYIEGWVLNKDTDRFRN